MRKLLFPIITLAVLVLWIEPFAAGRRAAREVHIQRISPVSGATPAAESGTWTTTSSHDLATTSSAAATRPADLKHVAQAADARTPSAPAAAAQKRIAKAPAAPATTQALAAAVGPPAPLELKSSGFSWKQVRGQPGFWRLGETAQGVWWFITPEDRLEFMNTVTTVHPFQYSRDPRGTIFISRDYDGTPTTPGNLKLWAQRTLQRIYATGFKGLGAWCNPVFYEMSAPITRDLNIWASVPAASQRLYDPGWLSAAEAAVNALVTTLRDNRQLMGYYLDNELDFSDARVGPSAYFDELPAENPNRQEVMKLIRELWPELEQFNAAWDLHLNSFDELGAIQKLPRDPPETYTRLQAAWIEKLMRDYFARTTQLVRKYDPNHLILGVRYAGYGAPEVVRASRSFTDAQSINYYVSDALLDPQLFRSMHELSEQPLIISEYSFHSLDNRSGNRNTVGFQAQVPDQKARADAYRLFTSRLARVPWIVGADWFQWADEPPSGRAGDGEDVNFGVVDVDDREYPLLIEAIKETFAKLNPLHLESHRDAAKDVWRDDFTLLPAQRVPYLAVPVRLNGELSDWPETARLHNLRMTQTVGMDRSEFPPPNVFLGWRKEGLYIAFEVFDGDAIAAPITSRYWTRDMVEFWLCTRPITTDQTGYNQYCHQFMFVPSDPSTTSDGVTGSVGQWHRPGDSLRDNLLPHPAIQYNCRILFDRYVVEMHVPAEWIHGWDPQEHPTMAFNIAVRNYQHAAAYFWSAPKEVQTQLRPATWGNIYLEQPTNPGETYGPVDTHNNTLTKR